jgi:Uma2 family endonuclease
MVIQDKSYPLDEFEDFIALPENRDRLFELINGEIVEKMPTQQHGIITLNIGGEVRTHVKQNNLGRVGVEVRHQMPGDKFNSRLPDISFYADTTTPVVERGAMLRMPDLAIEIKSPDDSLKEMAEKAAYYLANGSRVVWLVYPEQRLVEVLTSDDRQLLTETDTLDGGSVLPGFQMAVRDIFAY